MPSLIPKEFINELIFKTNIIDIINTRLPLKKVGKNYNTHCPFHQEKTPSFTVNFEKQFYFCFGCNTHGNIIDFLMNYEQLTFVESIKELAKIHGLTIPCKNINKEKLFNYEKITNLYLLTKNIADLYHRNIFKTEYAYQYILNRGIDKSMIKYFNLGFSPKNWYDLEKKNKKQCYNQKELQEIGILKTTILGYTYDRFKNRIIFPIRNKNGNIVGFGGRTLNNHIPKYINSPETQIFHKGFQLYGLYEMLKTNPKPKQILIVEGYVDVIALVQFKINYTISTLGTIISNEQIKLLFRTSNTIIFCYDGDVSGQKAAWRTLNISLSHIHDGKNVKFIFLPNNEDPDSIIRKEGHDNFKIRIKKSIDFSKFLLQTLFKKTDLNSISEKSHTSTIAISLIRKIPGKITQTYLFQTLSKKIGILDYHVLINNNINNINTKIYTKKPIKKTTIRIVIALLIQNPWLALTLPSLKHLQNYKIIGLSCFLDLVEKCISMPNSNTGQILEKYRNKNIFKHLANLAKWDHMIHNEKIKDFFLDSLTKICDIILEDRQNKLISQERLNGLNKQEKYELWSINKELAKK
ncbi:DNA primase [Buchnera aphidicola str. Bp (Baizongia pistaciae)]|uniref:DNA primase n=1 Tax=Buchnera aphidicola subsp. Baizongia pistaciae (strain Bp) TaxID=224915 RepID=DNAG_BUCBP|nr:DNA primase [Buchnera aphidicola]Q89B09.1 RecName: Full=DNA primase [Buchnera aphidicola str. Bp (Baizongia pistaciae)]AAO26792.1 DNA primase [Buchnera aphidicola str. Bp (Baizongia pistaciae)]